MNVSHSVLQCAFTHWTLLHIAGPAQRQRVDKPHPASVPGTLQAISGRAKKKIVHVVRNGSGVTDWNYWQFAQDTFNGDDVEKLFLVVTLVSLEQTDSSQPEKHY
jgi:hypothetical protein